MRSTTSADFLADVRLGPAWRRGCSDRRSAMWRYANDGAVIAVGARRSVDGWLRDAYPVGDDDIELFAVDRPASAAFTAALAQLSESILVADRLCRRIVFAAAAGDRTVISAAQSAGFRYVLDVDVPGVGLSLLVKRAR